MAELFDLNLEALKALRPSVYEKLVPEIEIFRTANGSQFFEQVDSPFANLVYGNKGEPGRLLYREEPTSECQRIFAHSDLSSATCLVFLGMGLGRIVKEFERVRIPSHYEICVIESNPQFFLRALSLEDFRPQIQDPHYFFVVTPSHSEAIQGLQQFFILATTVSRATRVLHQPSVVESNLPFYRTLSNEIPRIAEHMAIAIGTNVDDNVEGLKNCIQNLSLIFQNTGIEKLKDIAKGKTCISIASGPSLQENFGILKEYTGKIPFIACDSALRKLQREGIHPDFVTALERWDNVTKIFDQLPIDDRTTLIGPSTLLKSSFECFQGRKLVFSVLNQYRKTLNLDCIEALMPGHSAGNLNLVLAIWMGFKNIILVGHNLAYGLGTNRSHFEGIGDFRDKNYSHDELVEMGATLKVLTQDGLDEVYTEPFYDLFRLEIEGLIGKNPHSRFFNTAFKGARITGTKTITLENALKECNAEPFNIYPTQVKALIPPSPAESSKRKTEALTRIELAICQIKEKENNLSTLMKELKDISAKIKENEKIGSRLDVNFLNKALDSILDFKIRAADEDVVFSDAALSVLSPQIHMAERELNMMPITYKDEYLLKRDFIGIHYEKYFPEWQRYFPQIRQEYELAAETLKASSFLLPRGESFEANSLHSSS